MFLYTVLGSDSITLERGKDHTWITAHDLTPLRLP